MIDQMLADAGSRGINYTDWSVRYFLSNYFSSIDEPINSRDTWSETWEIGLNLAEPLAGDLTLPNDDRKVLRTFARDTTWVGVDPTLPAPYIIVARFYNEKLFTRAFAALSEFHDPRGSKDPEVQDLIDAIKEDPSSTRILVQNREPFLMELSIEIGAFDEASFSDQGARLAEQLSELIHEFGATITWDEKAAYLRNQHTHRR